MSITSAAKVDKQRQQRKRIKLDTPYERMIERSEDVSMELMRPNTAEQKSGKKSSFGGATNNLKVAEQQPASGYPSLSGASG